MGEVWGRFRLLEQHLRTDGLIVPLLLNEGETNCACVCTFIFPALKSKGLKNTPTHPMRRRVGPLSAYFFYPCFTVSHAKPALFLPPRGAF